MSEVLVLIDHAGGSVKKSSLELLTLAARLGDPAAVVIADPSEGRAACDVAARYGAGKTYLVDDAEIRGYLVAPKAEVLEQIARASAPAAILISSTAEGKEIAGRLAVKLDSGLVTDAVDVRADGTTTQSVFAGAYSVDARVTRGTPIITVKPNAVEPREGAGEGVVEPFVATISDAAKKVQIVASQPRESTGRPELTEALAIVSGGRGTGGNFAPVEGLADVLGAAVGASRAAVDSGWKPHALQVGQTGKVVSPQLYIAAGISGAIQHRAGMQTSQVIVAVNKDEEAPVFELADLGVVGDLHTVLPAATGLIRQRQG